MVGLKPDSLVLEHTEGVELEAVNGVERNEVEAGTGTEGSRDRAAKVSRVRGEGEGEKEEAPQKESSKEHAT